jgi:formylglycine-generating enzyme required for sulfatase activity
VFAKGLLAAAVVASTVMAQATVVIDTVTVGNPGNAGEAAGGAVGDARVSGAVGYNYRIGKYEVMAGQYTEFLNAVATTDPHGLYNANMASTSEGCQIQQSGSDGSYTYSVSSLFANRPVNYVSFWDATRFANWLHNGQGNGSTETGAYTLTSGGIATNTVARNAGASWAVTNEDEWYKAAYYDASTATYWDYPTKSNTVPGNNLTDASGNNGNFKDGVASYPIDSDKYTTVAGQFQNSASPYGTYDQGGNVWEWTESIMHVYNQPTNLANRNLEGGTWAYDSSYAQAAYRIDAGADYESSSIGFRMTNAVPEPGALALLTTGLFGLLAYAWRKRR